ncbi:MAG: hypothetical protein LBL48_00020 [Azoarcus sp.]|nr:hypothetical protein [Azoarcus sp.]
MENIKIVPDIIKSNSNVLRNQFFIGKSHQAEMMGNPSIMAESMGLLRPHPYVVPKENLLDMMSENSVFDNKLAKPCVQMAVPPIIVMKFARNFVLNRCIVASTANNKQRRRTPDLIAVLNSLSPQKELKEKYTKNKISETIVRVSLRRS